MTCGASQATVPEQQVEAIFQGDDRAAVAVQTLHLSQATGAEARSFLGDSSPLEISLDQFT